MLKFIKGKNSDISYRINKKAGITEAEIDRTKIFSDLKNCLITKGIPLQTILIGFKEYAKKYPTVGNICAKTICSKEDIFNEDLGKQIARNRLLEKYYKIRLNYLQYIGDELSKQIDIVEDQMNYSWLRYNDYINANKEIRQSHQ